MHQHCGFIFLAICVSILAHNKSRSLTMRPLSILIAERQAHASCRFAIPPSLDVDNRPELVW
jgi:hypothetical protein